MSILPPNLNLNASIIAEDSEQKSNLNKNNDEVNTSPKKFLMTMQIKLEVSRDLKRKRRYV